MKKNIIRIYMDEFTYYDKTKFHWDIHKDPYNNFRNYRMRKLPDEDIMPDFSLIEKDAIRFNMYDITFTDILGIEWIGKRGVLVYSGAPDYEQHLYYFLDDANDCSDDIFGNYLVSEKYTRDNYPSFKEGYIRMKKHHERGYSYYYIKDFIGINYEYHICNHLFKYTNIKINFKNDNNCEKELLFGNDGKNYLEILKYLNYISRRDLINKIYCQMNEHFDKLRKSDKEEEREFAPNKRAEEIFVINETK